MKKRILGISVLLFSLSAYSQVVADTILYKIPYLGKDGGQHIVNMELDNTTKDIIVNVYSNVRGGQLVADPNDIAKAKEEHKEKSFFGKMLSSMAQSNSYNDVVLPIAQENRVNVVSKRNKSIDNIFYTSDNVDSNKKVYFVPSSGMVDVGFRYNEGDILQHRYTDLNKVFTSFPKLDDVLMKFGNIEYKGEGLLGLKNIKPIIMKKEGIFRYDPTKGFVSDAVSTPIANAIDLIEDPNFAYVNESSEIFKYKTFSWYQNEDGDQYKMLYYDIDTNAKKVLPFNFENNRTAKVLNKSIYDESNKRVGFLTIFGFDKKQDKKKKAFTETQFNFIITDLEGNLLYNEIIDYGDEKAYKQVLSPTYVIRKNNGNLLFGNVNMQSLLKGNFEVCELDMTKNTLTSNGKQDLILKVGEGSMNVFDVLNKYDEVYKLNKNYVFIKNNVEAAATASTNSMIPGGKNNLYKGFNIMVMDENLQPLKIFRSKDSFAKDETRTISFYRINQNDNELLILDRQGSYFGLTKISDNAIERALIKTPYMNSASPFDYYGYFNQKPFLVDEDNKALYLIDQYYIKLDNSINIIDRIGITKVNY